MSHLEKYLRFIFISKRRKRTPVGFLSSSILGDAPVLIPAREICRRIENGNIPAGPAQGQVTHVVTF